METKRKIRTVQSHLVDASVDKLLAYCRDNRDITTKAVAITFSIPVATVRYHLSKHGIPMGPRNLACARADTVRAYCRKQSGSKTRTECAEELGVSLRVLRNSCAHYRDIKFAGKLPNLKAGDRFGMVVLEEDLNYTVRGQHKTWRCKCDCGIVFERRASYFCAGERNKRKHVVPSCGCQSLKRRGSDSLSWKGGRNQTRSGYILLRWDVAKDGPAPPNSNAKGDILEHVYVMSKVVGRALLTNETVHHINGVKDDNRPENLELWQSSHPAGQRVEDKVKYAIELLKLYKPEELANG